MAESLPIPDIGSQTGHLGEQIREQSLPRSREIVYGDENLVARFLTEILQHKNEPHTGVILWQFESYICLRLKDGNIYTVGSHFDVKDKLGNGAFGTVYPCIDKRSNRPFVIKCVKLLEDPKHYKSLEREIHALLRVKHQHVIKLIGIVKREDSYIHILLEQWGESLGNYLTKVEPEFNVIYFWFYQLLESVTNMHKHGLVHCDIHLGNILIHYNIIKLCDLGSVKEEGDELITPSHGNTPMYFPPTVLKHFYKGEAMKVSSRLDTYAVGKLLLEVKIREVIITEEIEPYIYEKSKWDDFVKNKIPGNTPVEIERVITGLMSYTTLDGISATNAIEILQIYS